MDRLLSSVAFVAAIGVGVAGYVMLDRQNGEIVKLREQMETLTKNLTETQKNVAGLSQDLAPIIQMIREQAPPEPQADMSKLTDEANAAYIASFAAKDGVVKLPSGAMYKSNREGPADGKKPTASSVVTVNYEGKFIDGTVFDSSYARGEPATFPLEGLIPGWVEIIPMMKEGDEWEVVLPYQLGYGERGRGAIPPKQTLTFRIELLKVES